MTETMVELLTALLECSGAYPLQSLAAKYIVPSAVHYVGYTLSVKL